MSFGDFWAIYPKKVAKFDAEKAWNQQLKRGYKPDDILVGVRAFVQLVAQRGTDRSFLPHAGSWLRGGRWLDDDLTQLASGRETVARDLFSGPPVVGVGRRIQAQMEPDLFAAYFGGCDFTESAVIAPTEARRSYILNKFGHLFRDVEFTTRKR